MTTPQAIVSLRGRMALNQEEFAKRLGVGRITISKLENGHRRPSRKLITRLSEIAKQAQVHHLHELFSAQRNSDIVERLKHPIAFSPRHIPAWEIRHIIDTLSPLCDKESANGAISRLANRDPPYTEDERKEILQSLKDYIARQASCAAIARSMLLPYLSRE
jgi:transcriptional regulator with XRE-family HTH domain